MCLIAPTQGIRLVKIWWDFGVMNLYFGLFCCAGVLCPSELGIAGFFSFSTIMLYKETWRKDCWSIRILRMFASLVSIHSKMWIQHQTSCLHQRLVSLAWFRATVGLICSYLFDKYSEFEQHMDSSDPRPDIFSLRQLERRRAASQASQPP